MKNSLLLLKSIVQKAATALSPKAQQDYIVSAVRSAMQVDVCSLYTAGPDDTLSLAATDGLDPASVGHVTLPICEGLVGHIARNNHPLNLERAADHPDYVYFPLTQEERYQAFLGAPIVHLRRLVGVLAVQETQRRKFSDEEEAFLVTIAAQLASPLALDNELVSSDAHDTSSAKTRRVAGIKGAPGIGIGTLHLLDSDQLEQIADQSCTDIDLEIRHFHEALSACRHDLVEGSRSLESHLPGDITSIFSVYGMLLDSNELISGVEEQIRQGNWAPGALRATIADYAARFDNMDDPYLRARAEDVRNIGNKLYHKLRGQAPAPNQENNLILCGDLVSITDITRFRREQLAGILCQSGSSLSHTAVLANALGLPAVMGTGKIKGLKQGTSAVIDGHQGQLILDPTQPVIEEFQTLVAREQSLIAELAELNDLPAETPDGLRVRLYTNTGLMADISPGLQRGAEGIGLYRSEIPFMSHDHFPTEAEQCEIYRHALKAYAGKPVTIRTLDIGGDKALPYFRFSEENPYLGWRGIRFTLDNKPVFMTQLRAMLRASAGLDNLQILLPMVSRVDELDAFSALLDNACSQLADEGLSINRPPVGVMVEVPAAVNLLPFFARRIQFVSIGSNDLTQYLLALDRNNSRVSRLFDNLHPAVLQEIYRIVQTCRRLGLPVSLCGEMAADPLAVVLLLGMRIESLSMSAYNLPKIKWLIRTLPAEVAEQTIREALLMEHESQIRALTRDLLNRYGLGTLVN